MQLLLSQQELFLCLRGKSGRLCDDWLWMRCRFVVIIEYVLLTLIDIVLLFKLRYPICLYFLIGLQRVWYGKAVCGWLMTTVVHFVELQVDNLVRAQMTDLKLCMMHELEPSEDMYLGYQLHLRLVRLPITCFVAILRILLATLGR